MGTLNRRQFLKYTCSTCALMLTQGVSLANPSNQFVVKDIKGSLRVNQKDAVIGSSLNAGDTATTTANSTAVLLFGEDACHLKPSTSFTLPSQAIQDNTANLTSGAILAAFQPGKSKRILVNQKATLVIRGTGVYIGRHRTRDDRILPLLWRSRFTVRQIQCDR